jgi:hypothetical protein
MELDKEKVIEIFRMNLPAYFHPNEFKDFLIHLESHGNAYYVLLEDDQIVGAGGYHIMSIGAIARIN